MPVVSIIVPVYKVEKYLRRCLDSIAAQTFTDWECILIDDGSPDNSGKICDEYAKLDERFRVFHQGNAGVSTARNKGLDEAKGEWITFVDSDDWIENNALSIMVTNVKSNCLIVAGIKNINDISTKEQFFKYNEVDINYFINKLYTFNPYGYIGYLFPKLFNNQIIKNSKIRFNEGIFYNEDRLFVLQYVLNCNSVLFLDKVTYNYFIRDDSAMGQIKHHFSEKMVTELTAFDLMLDILSKLNAENHLNCSIDAFFAACRLEDICDDKSYNYVNTHIKSYFSIACKTKNFKTKLKIYKQYILSKIKKIL